MKYLTTMKDVADRAGVHPSTVSLTLSNSPRVAPATRERILRAVQELGYRPNPYIRALMQSRRKNKSPAAMASLVLLTTFPTREGCVAEFPLLKAAFAAAKQQAESRGFHLEEFWAPLDKMPTDRLSQILDTRGVSGILLAPFPRPLQDYGLRWERFAVVAWGMSLSHPRVHHVRSNHFVSLTMAMDRCRELGYRRIGLAVRRDANIRVDKHWEAAYLVKLREYGTSEYPEPLLAEDWTRTTFLEWYRTERPDVILCYTRKNRSLEWLRAEGIRIPEDVGFVSLSCTPGGEVSGVIENFELQAVRAVNLLIGLVTDNDLGLHDCPNLSVVEPGWNAGRTLRRKAVRRGDRRGAVPGSTG